MENETHERLGSQRVAPSEHQPRLVPDGEPELCVVTLPRSDASSPNGSFCGVLGRNHSDARSAAPRRQLSATAYAILTPARLSGALLVAIESQLRAPPSGTAAPYVVTTSQVTPAYTAGTPLDAVCNPGDRMLMGTCFAAQGYGEVVLWKNEPILPQANGWRCAADCYVGGVDLPFFAQVACVSDKESAPATLIPGEVLYASQLSDTFAGIIQRITVAESLLSSLTSDGATSCRRTPSRTIKRYMGRVVRVPRAPPSMRSAMRATTSCGVPASRTSALPFHTGTTSHSTLNPMVGAAWRARTGRRSRIPSEL